MLQTTSIRHRLPTPSRESSDQIAAAAAHIEDANDRNSAIEDDEPLHTSTDPIVNNIPNNSNESIWDGTDWPIDELRPTSISEAYDGVAGRIIDGGLDCIAFYKSFRHVRSKPARGRWGIFFIRSRCVALAADMAADTMETPEACLDALVELVYTHELYHYKLDAYCLQIESSGGNPLYRPYRRLVNRLPMQQWNEESVANAYGLAALKRNCGHLRSSIHQFLETLVASSPGAYASGINKNQTPWKDALAVQVSSSLLPPKQPNEVHSVILSTIRAGTNLGSPTDPTLGRMLHFNSCPVYWIDWAGANGSILTPLTISVREMEREFIGRYLAGVPEHTSDHKFYKIDNGTKVKMPNPHNADVSNGEFKNIIGKAGMTGPAFHLARRETVGWKKNVPRTPILMPRDGF